jgi:UDP-GlcNAc:undecaprenyl-phosphate GlcNAc-1-phosphate transferase
MTTLYLISFVSAVLLSFVLTRMVRNLANRKGWVALPASERHIHSQPMPRLGGVAIYTAFSAVAILLLVFSSRFQFDIGITPQMLLSILLTGTMIFLLGLYDDVRPLPPFIKILVQSLAATILYYQGSGIFQVPFFGGEPHSPWLALPITIFWVLLITNAFNLIDGLDGLAAGSALFSTVTVFVVGVINSNLMVALLTVTLAGAILGFLRFNFNPATIFLGDSGSLFIGFILSACALVGSQKTPTVVAVAIPVVSFGLPILETTISLVRRFISGRPLFTADREHIHHKLLELGLSQKQAVIVLYGVSAACGLLSLFLLNPNGGTVGIVLFVLGVGVWVGVQHLGYHEFFEIGRMAQRTIDQKRIITNNLAIRKATTELSRAKNYETVSTILQAAFEKNEFDGFHLQVCAGSVTKFDYVWSKDGEDHEKHGAVWKLLLDLVAEDGQKLGSLEIYRAYCNKPCLVDVSLLVSHFQMALVAATQRILSAERRASETAKEAKAAGGLTAKGLTDAITPKL